MEIQAATVAATVATTALSTVFVDNSTYTPSTFLMVATGLTGFASLVVSVLSVTAGFFAVYLYNGFQKWQANMEEKQKKMDERQAETEKRVTTVEECINSPYKPINPI